MAVALLLYQPTLAQDITDIDELQHSDSASVKLLLELIALLKQRPEFSSAQILGYWQGAHGVAATTGLQSLMDQATLFQHASELSVKDQRYPFDPSREFNDALHHLKRDIEQQNCETIVQRLNQKPFSEWSHSDKQLYRKVTSQSNH